MQDKLTSLLLILFVFLVLFLGYSHRVNKDKEFQQLEDDHKNQP